MKTYRRGFFGLIWGILQIVCGTLLASLITYLFFKPYVYVVGGIAFLLLLWMVVSEGRLKLTLDGSTLTYTNGKEQHQFHLSQDTDLSYHTVRRSGGADECTLLIDGVQLDCSGLGYYKFQILYHDLEAIVGKKVYRLN